MPVNMGVMPAHMGVAGWKMDSYGFHSILLNELYPQYIPQGEQSQIWYSYHAYESLLIPEQRVAYGKIASDITNYIRMDEPWMLDMDQIAISLSGSGRKKQMGIVCETRGQEVQGAKRVSFLFNCTGQKLKQTVRFQTFIEQILMAAGYTQEVDLYLQERQAILDEVRQPLQLGVIEYERKLDMLQGKAFDMIGRILTATGTPTRIVPGVLLRLMFGDTDLIVIDQRNLAHRNTCTWYPLSMGKGLKDPMAQIDWEGRLQGIRQSTRNVARIYFDNGAVFSLSINLRSLMRPGQRDYITISLVEVPWSEWQLDIIRMDRVISF